MNTTAVAPYLNFNGNCREAMNFYKACIGGSLEIMGFEGAPMEVPAESKDAVMHAILKSGAILIMASDTMPGHTITFGDSVSLSINCESKAQTDAFFNALVAGGKVNMPLEETFWGAYFGMITDKFGIHWMFNYDDPAKTQK